jgi:GT2 family glycosyltransferase
MSANSLDRVSVVIVSWNVRDQLQRALELLASARELEIVVVDNASEDQSAEMVAAEFPWVRLVRNQSNTLYAPAVNQGAALCERPWLLLLNPDCEVTPETLRPLAQFLAENPGYGAVAPLLTDGKGQAAPGIMEAPGFWTPLFFGTPLERWLPNSRELKRWFCRGRDYSRDQDVPQPPAACLLVRRSSWDLLGGMDSNLALFFNDADLCLRLIQGDQRIRLLTGLRALHRTGSSTRQLPDFAAHWHRDRLRYQRKHFGFWAGPFVKLCTSWSLLDLLLRGFGVVCGADPRNPPSPCCEPLGGLCFNEFQSIRACGIY